jgi:hypothetical protein
VTVAHPPLTFAWSNIHCNGFALTFLCLSICSAGIDWRCSTISALAQFWQKTRSSSTISSIVDNLCITFLSVGPSNARF